MSTYPQLGRDFLCDVLELAFGEARWSGKEYLEVGHIFMALLLLMNGRTQAAIRRAGFAPGYVYSVIRLAIGMGNSNVDNDILPTSQCKEVLHLSNLEAISANMPFIDELAIVKAILKEKDGEVPAFLYKLGIDPEQFLTYVIESEDNYL